MTTTTHNSTARTSPIPKIANRTCVRILWATLILLGAALTTFAAPPESKFVRGQILIKPKATLSENNWSDKINRHGGANRRTLHRLNVRVVAVPEEKAEAILSALRADPDIEFAERDYLAEATFVPNDPYVTSGTAWHLARIQAPEAWDLGTGLTDTVVAVLDSGVNAAHPDLAGQILPGYDFVSNDTDPADDLGHGTAVAGTIIALGNNGAGSAGVAFGCRVLPVKVLDSSGYATYSSLAQAIKFAVDQGARVINMSVGGSSSSATLQAAVDYAWSNNVVIVAAAGNNANNVPQYPGACDHVIAVSATVSDDTLASFSSYGTYVSLAAPGTSILTTQYDLSRPYGSWSGTSFSSPIVAGVAALVAAENPSLSNTQIVSVLQQSADDVGATGRDDYFGFGRVNAYRALRVANGDTNGLPPPPPPPPADTNAPTIILVQAPKNGARVATPQVSLAGSARDNIGLREIQVLVNGVAQPVDDTTFSVGTTYWKTRINLAAGLNVVKVRSVDLAGNLSAEVTRKFTFVVLVPLTTQVNGLGRVVPVPTRTVFEIGKVYSVKAIPGTGQIFAGWNGEPSPSPMLNFIMQSNLTVVADFVPTPFPPVKGTYVGLASDPDGVMPQSSGYFALAVTSMGAFTGQLKIGGAGYPFHGRFDLEGNALVSVKRKLSTPLTLALHVDLNQPLDRVDGSITDGVWTSDLTGDRNVFNATLNPAPQAGSRTFILERADDTSVTAATGASIISLGGATKVKGTLMDLRPFSTGSLLAKNGDYPFYLSLRRGQEVVIGWLNFPAVPSPTASGTVLWVRTGTNTTATTLQAAPKPGL